MQEHPRGIPAFTPVEAVRYGRLSIAQVEYTFAPQGHPYGLDKLDIIIRVIDLAMVNLALLVDVEPGALRLTMEPVGDIIQPFNDMLLDQQGLLRLTERIADLRIIMTRAEPLIFHFRNVTPYEVDFVLDVGAALVTEDQAAELRRRRGP